MGNISNAFTIDNMKKIGLKGSVIFLPVDFNPIDTLMEEKCNSNQWWDNGKSQCEC